MKLEQIPSGSYRIRIMIDSHTISDETAALTDKALNHFDSVTKFVTN